MKYYLLLTVLLSTFSVQSQTLIGAEPTDNFIISISSDANNKVVAYQKKDSALVVLDSAGTIKSLINWVLQSQKENDREYERYFSIQQILMYIKEDGTITDKKKFREAVKHYENLK